MRCPECNAENPAQARFCLMCGARLVAVCPQCRTELPPDAKFCFSCGASLAARRSDPLGEALQRLVPKEYAERLLATRGQVGHERRLATVLFSDIKSYSAMAEHLDPEDVLDIVNGAFQFLIAPIYRYEGTITHLIGDAILAFFGAPITHEDDPERACRAALEIIAGSREYAARLERERGIRGFAVRVGIHTGLVVAGEVGSDLRMAYTAIGDTVNLASRMETAAEPGTVLMTGETQRLTAPLFETLALGSIQVKNRAEPVPVYRLLGSKGGHPRSRGIEGLESPLVGRSGELGRLHEALERLQAGVGGIVTVVGEAGLGKSRLVAEARQGVTGSNAQWLEGRCLSYGGAIAYLLWLDVLRALLGVTEEQAPTDVLPRLRDAVQSLCPERYDEVYPYLARLLSLPLEPEAEADLHELGGERLKAGTFRAVETLLECAAHRRPLVLVCEDLHWADPTSLELLERLLSLSERASLLVICALRPERGHGCWRIREAAGRDYSQHHTDLWLNPLSGQESEALVANLLRVEGLPATLRQRILERAEGNPFYVEEVIRALIDSGAIARDEASGQWRAARDVAEIAIPETLQGALAARIDRLQEDTRRVLRMAAVIGRAFLYRVLSRIAQEESDLDRHLVTLQHEEMIRERARLPELEFIFKHYLTQEAAYNGLLRRDRRVYHRQVAEALEGLFPERREEMAGLLAYHWERAEEPRRAIDYLLQAGDQARLLYAHAEAGDFYERALALVQQQGDPERTARTLLKLGQTYHTAFDYVRARQAYDEGFALWRQVATDAQELPPAPHPLRIPFWLPVLTLDPQMAYVTDAVWVARHLFRGLVELTSELDVVPDLAERWEVLEGGRRYLFHLRQDALWSDGTPLTAADLEYAWKRLLDPATGSPQATDLYDLRNGRAFHQGQLADPAQLGVRAEGPYTLSVELEQPVGHFLTLLAGSATYALPRHAVQAHGADWVTPSRIVTSGPFLLEAWEDDGSLALVRNPTYRGRRRGNVQRLELTYVQSSLLHSGTWPELLARYGEDDQHVLPVPALPATELERLSRSGEHVTWPALGTQCLCFVVSLPPFGDPRVRRALAQAIDRSALPRVVSGYTQQAGGGLIPPGMPGHAPNIGLPCDPPQAARLLAEAGYPGGQGFPQLELISFSSARDVAQTLQSQWREHLGIASTMEIFDSVEALYARLRSRPPGAFLMAWIGDSTDPDDMMGGTEESGTGWHHSAFARLVEQARRTMDQAERIRMYQQADRILIQEAAIVPLTYVRNHWLVKPWVKRAVSGRGLEAMKDAIIEPHE